MSWEFTLLDALQCIHTPVLDKLMVGVTFLGDAGWFWIALGVLLLFTKKYRKTGILILTALCFSALFANLMLKPLVARERPCWINESVHLLVAMPKDYSFPSGHTQASFASATAIFHVNKKAGVCAFILAVLIAFSRPQKVQILQFLMAFSRLQNLCNDASNVIQYQNIHDLQKLCNA